LFQYNSNREKHRFDPQPGGATSGRRHPGLHSKPGQPAPFECRNALVCYRAIYWIAGGRPKADGLKAVLPELHRVRRAYLIGEAEAAFVDEIGARAPVERCGDLACALEAAHRDAQSERLPGATVLLSPACASFDQWPSFAARGDAFRSAAERLVEDGP